MEWPLLRGLPDEDVRRVLAAARRRRFSRGEVIFHDGDLADTLHLIASGRVAVRVTTPLGDTATMAMFGPGDVLGEMALLTAPGTSSPGVRTATVIAIEASETLVIHQDVFAALRREHPSVTDVLVRILAERVRDLTVNLVEALYVPADKRVLRRLLTISALYAHGEGEVVVPLTQEDLAGLAGTTRPTVNRVLREEEKRGSLRLGRGKVEILDRGAIEKRSR